MNGSKGSVFSRIARAIKKKQVISTSPRLEKDHQGHSPESKSTTLIISPRPEATEEQKKEIRHLWGKALSPSALSGATLKINSLAPSQSLPTHLPQRQFAIPLQNKTTKADYTILEKIADGGMGSIFVGEQKSLKRHVAIKTINEDLADDASTRIQFLTEAIVTGELSHPNIVPVHELGTNDDNLCFYTMEYVKGISWYECITNKSQDENLEILLKVCDAVAFAHSRNIIHRDLKPENIMIGDFGQVLLMDWGMASPAKAGRDSKFHGTPNDLGGTPAYMPPECAVGDYSRIGTASDIYLIGAILFEIISGKAPHHHESAEESIAAAASNLIPKVKITGELISIALKAMETEPEKRYPSVIALQRAIRNYRKHEESLTLTYEAEDNYVQARITGSYEEYSAGLHACYEALKLWKNNATAQSLSNKIRLDYARLSMKRQDYDLCLTLLRKNKPEDRPLIDKANRLKQVRSRQIQRQRRLKYTLIIITATTLIIMVTSYITVSRQRTEALYLNFIQQTKLAMELLNNGDWIGVHKLESEVSPKFRGWEWNWLQRASKLELMPLGKIGALPLKIESSSSHSSLAYLYSDGLLKIKDQSGMTRFDLPYEIRDFQWLGHPSQKKAMVLHGNRISHISLKEDSSWKIKTVLEDTGNHAVSLSPSGQLYLINEGEGRLHIHQVSTGQRLSSLDSDSENAFLHPAFSHDDRLVAGFSGDGQQIFLFDTHTGNFIDRTEKHSKYTPEQNSELQFSKDGASLFILGSQSMVVVCSTEHMVPRFTLPLSGEVLHMSISKDESLLLATGSHGEFIIFDTSTGDKIWEVNSYAHQFEHLINRINPGEWELVNTKGETFLLDASQRDSGQVLFKSEVPTSSILWSEDDQRIFSMDRYSNIDEIHISKKTIVKLKSGRSSISPFVRTQLQGKEILIGGNLVSGLYYIDVASGDITTFPEIASINGLYLDGDRLFITNSHYLQLWSVSRKKIINQWEFPEQELHFIQLMDKNHLWASTGSSLNLCINLHTGKVVRSFHSSSMVRRWVLSHDKKWLADLEHDRTLKIRDPITGNILHQLSSQNHHAITDVCFTPDNRRLIASSADGNVHIWDTSTWQKILRFRAHLGTVVTLNLSHDGRYLATSGTDCIIKLWDSLPLGNEPLR